MILQLRVKNIIVPFLLDLGTENNYISLDHFLTFVNSTNTNVYLKPTEVRIRNTPTIGTFETELHWTSRGSNNFGTSAEFFVVLGRLPRPIIGAATFDSLGGELVNIRHGQN